MKKVIYLFTILLLVACSSNEKILDTPKKVIIAGKVLNHDANNRKVQLSVNRLGLASLQIRTELDSLGNFHTSFQSYVPTDVWVLYKTNFLVLTHPGDSIHLVFDGIPNNRPEILETVEFSGDAVESNLQATKFQQMYYSNPIYNDWGAKEKAIKEYDVDQYLLYLDTVQLKTDSLYNSFTEQITPNKEVQIWAKTYIEQDYYNALAWYPSDHKMANNLNSTEWSVPDSYYDALLSRLPIKREMFISGYALSNFINRFRYNYAERQIWNEEENRQYKIGNGISGPTEIIDSLAVYGLIKHTSNPLLRQLVLTEMISQNFERSDLRQFEKHADIIKSTITEPFLIKPLLEQYAQIKERLDNPKVASDALLKEISNTSAKQIMDSIIADNKGKVIYLDVWATWCGPCKAEMPNSIELMDRMEGKDVAFVFLCIDSEEKGWKATLAELQLPGQQYFLTQEQSADIRKVFEINGVPYYFLINKQGNINEKGSHLRPGTVEARINGLLEE